MSKFGWSMPAGAWESTLPGEEEYPCDICGGYPGYDCECPECPKCGVAGDPDCITSHMPMTFWADGIIKRYETAYKYVHKKSVTVKHVGDDWYTITGASPGSRWRIESIFDMAKNLEETETTMKSDAQATIEFCILDAISRTYGTDDHTAIVRAVVESLFSKETVWAVREYAGVADEPKPLILVATADKDEFEKECAKAMQMGYKLSSSAAGFVPSEDYGFCDYYQAIFYRE